MCEKPLATTAEDCIKITEIIRGGIQSIDKGQMEAARSLGLSNWQAMRLVILPQAIKNSLPALISEFIALLKETSVVGWIGLNDIMRGADNIRFQTATAFQSLFRNVQLALEFEERRQRDLLLDSNTIVQDTRLWNPDSLDRKSVV